MKLIRKFFGVVCTFHYHFHTSSSKVWEIEPNFCFYTAAAIDARSDMYIRMSNQWRRLVHYRQIPSHLFHSYFLWRIFDWKSVSWWHFMQKYMTNGAKVKIQFFFLSPLKVRFQFSLELFLKMLQVKRIFLGFFRRCSTVSSIICELAKGL